MCFYYVKKLFEIMRALKSYLLFCLISFLSVISQSAFIYEYENRQNRLKFMPLVVKIANLGPTIFMEFIYFMLQSVDKAWLQILTSHFLKILSLGVWKCLWILKKKFTKNDEELSFNYFSSSIRSKMSLLTKFIC